MIAVRLLALLVLPALLAACGRAPVRDERVATQPALVRGDAERLAQSVTIGALGLVGTPYRYGGNTPAGGVDCSGLIGHVYREGAGLALPRTVAGLAEAAGPEIPVRRMRSGDLVFFSTSRRRPDHAGIYVGEGRFVHAPSSGGTVRLDRLDAPYWRDRLQLVRRPLGR